MIEYTISENNLHLKDSHKVSKFRFMRELKAIRTANPGSNVWNRCLSSLYLEWIVHNFLYEIGYERDRTADADLDNPCDRPEAIYIIFGIIVWPFTFKTK